MVCHSLVVRLQNVFRWSGLFLSALYECTCILNYNAALLQVVYIYLRLKLELFLIFMVGIRLIQMLTLVRPIGRLVVYFIFHSSLFRLLAQGGNLSC